jgi:hypothetical protein
MLLSLNSAFVHGQEGLLVPDVDLAAATGLLAARFSRFE